MIDFTIPPDLDAVRTRVRDFVREIILPVESPDEHVDETLLRDLRAQAKAAGLWTPHLPPEWGGLGMGPLGMALVSQELGVTPIAPLVLNASAPDEGNMHLLLHAGRPDQLERYLRPLAAGADSVRASP